MVHNHKNHMWMMAISCGGALLLILLLPFFGVSKNLSSWIAIAVMVILHLWMMKGHSSHNNHEKHKGVQND